MSELMSVLDGLAADDLCEFSGRAVLDRTTVLVVARNRIDAELARTVRRSEVLDAAELDDGIKTMQSWLRGHCRLSAAEAFRVVRRGRALESLPAVAAAFADGMITAEQVTVAAAVTRPEHVSAAAAQDVDVTQIDAALAEVAMTRQHADLGKVVHHYLERLDPDGTEPDPTEGRRLSITTSSDGSVTGSFQLDALGGEKAQAALEAIAQADRPQGDMRSRPQQLADAFVQLCDIALGFGKLPMHRGSKPHVVVTIGASDLFDPAVGQGAARLGFGSWFSAQRTRQLACDGDLTPITIDEYGVPLNEGRTKRVVPPHIRRAVVLRDQHCVFAGCTAPSYWCDVHHLVHWIDDGETSLENSGLLCERHHTKVHHGFTIERDPTGRWHTYRPDGTEILIQPLLI
jgi:hypothetical protein